MGKTIDLVTVSECSVLPPHPSSVYIHSSTPQLTLTLLSVPTVNPVSFTALSSATSSVLFSASTSESTF